MDFIGNFLNKYSKFIDATVVLKEVVINVIKEVVGVQLTRDDIIIKEGVITIRKSPAVKMEILLNQEEIITTIKQKLPTVTVVKIV